MPARASISPQVNDHLLVDVLLVRRLQNLGLAAECDLELSVEFFGRGPDCLEQRPHLAPLDVAARGMAEDPLDRVAVIVAEVSHGYPSTDSTRGPRPLRSESRLAPAIAPSVALLHRRRRLGHADYSTEARGPANPPPRGNSSHPGARYSIESVQSNITTQRRLM
jgi:hypothetical protein